MEENKIVSVLNRNNGHTGYEIPDAGIKRTFTPGEVKKISLEELKQLQYTDGGDYLLKHYLVIVDEGARDELNMAEVEPEYFYTEDEVLELLKNGSLDQLEDALNFAPEGVIELIKSIAVKIELPDTRKRKLILDKTGFNIDNVIAVNATIETNESDAEAPVKARKADPITAKEPTKVRKATPAASKYNVVSK